MPNDRFVGKLPTTQPPNEHDARVVASATSALHGIAATRACLNCDNGFRRRGDDLVPCETCNAKARPMSQEAMAREHRQRSVAPVIPVGSEAPRRPSAEAIEAATHALAWKAACDDDRQTYFHGGNGSVRRGYEAVARPLAIAALNAAYAVEPQGTGHERVIPATDLRAFIAGEALDENDSWTAGWNSCREAVIAWLDKHTAKTPSGRLER